MRLKKSTQIYLSAHTQCHTVYDGSTWAITGVIAMRLPSDYVLDNHHQTSNNFIPKILESSGFYDSLSFLMVVDLELWRDGLACRKNTDLILNKQYKYQSKLVKLFDWQMMSFKASLKSGFLYLFDLYTGDLCGIILPIKLKGDQKE